MTAYSHWVLLIFSAFRILGVLCEEVFDLAHLSDEVLIEIAQKRGFTILREESGLEPLESFESLTPLRREPISSSLAQMEFTYTSHHGTHVEEAEKFKEQEQMAKRTQATKCYPKPCQWVDSNTKQGYGYYTMPDLGQIPETQPQPTACPENSRMEWVFCNDGKMDVDGCRGYCSLEASPGYVSMIAPRRQGAPHTMRLVTKGELDLLQAQFMSTWSVHMEFCRRLLAQTKEVLMKITDQTAGFEADDQAIGASIQKDQAVAEQESDRIHKGFRELQREAKSSFSNIETQHQLAMIASLHGVSGMCCCAFGSSSREPTCDWYPFRGDIDQRSIPATRYQYTTSSAQGIGAVTPFGFSDPTRLMCGTSEKGKQMISYATMFAAKEMHSGWNHQDYGPFYFEAEYGLRSCASSKGWTNFMASPIGYNKSFQFTAFEFPAFDPHVDASSTAKMETLTLSELKNLNPRAQTHFTVTTKLSEFVPPNDDDLSDSALMWTKFHKDRVDKLQEYLKDWVAQETIDEMRKQRCVVLFRKPGETANDAKCSCADDIIRTLKDRKKTKVDGVRTVFADDDWIIVQDPRHAREKGIAGLHYTAFSSRPELHTVVDLDEKDSKQRFKHLRALKKLMDTGLHRVWEAAKRQFPHEDVDIRKISVLVPFPPHIFQFHAHFVYTPDGEGSIHQKGRVYTLREIVREFALLAEGSGSEVDFAAHYKPKQLGSCTWNSGIEKENLEHHIVPRMQDEYVGHKAF